MTSDSIMQQQVGRKQHASAELGMSRQELRNAYFVLAISPILGHKADGSFLKFRCGAARFYTENLLFYHKEIRHPVIRKVFALRGDSQEVRNELGAGVFFELQPWGKKLSTHQKKGMRRKHRTRSEWPCFPASPSPTQ